MFGVKLFGYLFLLYQIKYLAVSYILLYKLITDVINMSHDLLESCDMSWLAQLVQLRLPSSIH